MDDIESFMAGQFTFKKFTDDNSSFSQSWKVNVVKSYRNLLEEIGKQRLKDYFGSGITIIVAKKSCNVNSRIKQY